MEDWDQIILNIKRAIDIMKNQFKNVSINYLDGDLPLSVHTQLNTIFRGNFVFIIATAGKWFTLSNIKNVNKTEWTIYGCQNEFNNVTLIQTVLEKLTPDKIRTVKVQQVQNKFGDNENHLFALAYAISLCRDKQPEKIKYEQISMHHQFEKLLRDKFVSEFDGIELNFELTKGFYMLVNKK